MPQSIPLWPDDRDLNIRGEKPSLTPFLSTDKAARALVVVCPGGGYGMLADHEGPVIARWLNDHGFHAAVLRYRLAPNRHPAMINDAQRAIRMVRKNAGAWGVDPKAIAILGFSAGGHLAASATVHYDRFTCPQDDLAGPYSARPDAAVLCYPVIDFGGEFSHAGSRANLLGENPDPALVELFSNHKQVTPRTPPTFLWHTADDDGVPMENSLLFAMACRRARVPVEVHVFDKGRHGLGLATTEAPAVAVWSGMCLSFLRRHLLH